MQLATFLPHIIPISVKHVRQHVNMEYIYLHFNGRIIFVILEATSWPNNLFRSCYKHPTWCASPTACAISINVSLGQRQENLKKGQNSGAILGPLGTIKRNKLIGQLFVSCLSCVLVLRPCSPSRIFRKTNL